MFYPHAARNAARELYRKSDAFPAICTKRQDIEFEVTLGSGPIEFRLAACSRLEKRAVDMSDLFWSSDAQMARLDPFFPKSHALPGRRFAE